MIYLVRDVLANALGEWAENVTVGSVFLRLSLALLFGAIIGSERANKRHAAGLRTFILTTIAGAIAMLVDVVMENGFYFVSAAVVVGVAIMSTNTTVFSSRSQIKGITTSVALWVCAIVGLTLGAGLYVISLVSFITLLLSLSLFPTFEQYMKNRSNYFEVHLELKNASYLTNFIETGRKLGLRIDDIESNPAYLNSGLSVYTISVSVISKELKKYKTHSEIIEALKSLDYVSHIEEMN